MAARRKENIWSFQSLVLLVSAILQMAIGRESQLHEHSNTGHITEQIKLYYFTMSN